MSSDENKAFVREALVELFRGNLAIADQAFAPSFVGHNPAQPDPIRGPEGVKRSVSTYLAAFPDVSIAVEEQIAEGDRVVTRWTASGTHRGELMGIAPTGKLANISGITVARLAGGQIVEGWTNWDRLGLLQQLGIAPASSEAGR